ncbi:MULTISPECIES: CHAT domain-containing protein [unclassified Knoellia]|uniref:CHAT domain-containing protein n=1 Tax=Knoellia altitudinis TaxID=3404795 RepID=UPI00360BC85B
MSDDGPALESSATGATTNLAHDLLEVAVSAPDQFPARLDAVEPLSSELAVELALSGFSAIDASDLPRAKAAFGAAMVVFSQLQDWPRAVDCGVRQAEVTKVLAVTVEEHELARESARAMMGLARRLRLPSLVFHASVVVADSAYFAGHAAREQRDQDSYRRWLLVALDDCVEALALIEADPDSDRARMLVSLVGVTVREVRQQHWFDEQRADMDRSLRNVALATESFVAPGTRSFTGEDPNPSTLEMVLAKLSYEAGSPDSGRERLLRVLELAEEQGDLDTFMSGAAVLYAGERSSHRPHAELTAIRERFAGAVDSFRTRSRSRAGRLWMAQQLDELNGDSVSDEFSMLLGRDVDRAHHALERCRARTLLDEMTGRTRDLDEAQQSRAAALEADVMHLEAPPSLRDEVGEQIRLTSRLPIGGLTPSPERLQSLAELESLYAAHDAGFVGTTPVGTIDTVIESLGPDEAVVSYYLPYNPLDPAGELLILAITSHGALPVHLPLRGDGGSGFTGRIQADGRQPIDASPLGELIINTRLSILNAEEDDAKARLAELYRILVTPLEEVGISVRGWKTLYVVPHGILHGVPFAALRTPEGTFLAEEVATVVVPSVSVWEELRRRPPARPTSFLGFANPVLEDFEPLPDTELELADVGATLSGLDSRVLVGAEATEAALRQEVAGRSIVHFATHGEFPEADVLNMHRIMLTPASDHDGHVNAEELRGMDLRAAQLVVLSICDGGVYRFGPGDEPYGLLSALLTAGARTVLGPLWVIDDTEARLLVTAFYGSLLSHGPALALQDAAVQRMRAGAQIRDWAGFVVFGAGTWSTP